MSYQSWSVVFGEQPSAAKWNILGTNDSSFHDGSGIQDKAILAQHLGQPVAFAAHDISGTSFVNSTPTKGTWITEDYDYGSNFASSKFVAPYDGIYWFAARGGDFTATCTRGFASLYVNASEYLRGSDVGNGRGVEVAGMIKLTATDYVEAYFFQTSGANRTGSSSSQETWFKGSMVGRL